MNDENFSLVREFSWIIQEISETGQQFAFSLAQAFTPGSMRATDFQAPFRGLEPAKRDGKG